MEFQCIECNQEFNTEDRSPHMLPSCGHSICQACLHSLINSDLKIVCKEDGLDCDTEKDIKNFPYNQSILTLIKKKQSISSKFTITPEHVYQNVQDVSEFADDKSNGNSAEIKANFCQLHQKDIELICMDDGQYICVSCGLFGAHKNHNLKPIDEFGREIEIVFNEITSVYEELCASFEASKSQQWKNSMIFEINKQKSQHAQEIHDQFIQLITAIQVLEQDLIIQLDAEYKRILNQKIDQVQHFMSQVETEQELWISQVSSKLQSFSNFQADSVHKSLLSLGSLQQNRALCSFGREIIDRSQKAQNDASSVISAQVNPIAQFKFNEWIDQLRSQLIRKEYPKESEEISLIEEKQNLGVSDMFIQSNQQIQKFEQSLKLEQSQKFDQSQPSSTQPQSPSFDFQRKEYFAATTAPLTSRKDRSRTMIQTEFDDAPSMPPQLSTRKKATVVQLSKKYCKDPKMNDKILASLSAIHSDMNEMVDMSCIDFSIELTTVLADYLIGRKTLKVLKLGKCKLNDEMINIMIPALNNTNIHTIHLQSNSITERCFDILLAQLRLKKLVELKHVYLNGNQINQGKSKKKIDELRKNIQINI